MAAPESNIGLLIEVAITNGLINAGIGFPTGTAPLIGQEEEATIGGSMAQSQWDAVSAVLADTAHSPGLLSDMTSKAMEKAVEMGSWVYGKLNWGSKQLIEIPLNQMIKQGIATPDKALGNMGEAFAMTTTAGLLAAVISDIPSLSILGCLDLNLRSVSAFLAKMGGWDQIFGQVWGPLMRGFVGQPMRYKINELFMPFMPGPMDIMRMRYKRILPGAMNPATTPPGIVGQGHPGLMPGYDHFKKLMAYQGFPPDWSEIIENDLYSEPRYFELGVMGQNPAIPEKWWWEKCRRMGYNEMDAGMLVGGIKNKIAGGYIQAMVNEILTSYREGIIGDDRLKELVMGSGIDDLSQRFVLLGAEWKKHREIVSDQTKVIQGQFSRDQITVEEMRYQLDLYYEDPEAVDRTVNMAEINRYRRVYWTTEIEDARKAFGSYRRLFLAGVLTEWEYEAYAIEAGMEGPAWEAMYELDRFRREQSVVKEFQAYGLPRLRDLVLHGELSINSYRRELRDGGFPDEYLGLEVELTEVKLRDRVAQTVRRDELPAYERGYVVGLVSRGNLRGVMEQAGLDHPGINARLMSLDYDRDQFVARREAAITAEREKKKEEAKRRAEKLAAELEHARAQARGITEKWAKEKAEQAKEQSRLLAESLIAEARKGVDASTERLTSLTDQLTDALWWAHVSAA